MSQYLTLNAAAMEALKQPFAAQFHDFRQGFVYLAERAVCERIEEVDPAWSFLLTDIRQREDQIVVTATMTILGTSRQGVGMSDIKMIGKSNNEAEKGAATDALRRCARLFGVGRYLLDTPQSVNDERSLSAWLATIGQAPTAAPAPNAPAPQQRTPNANQPQTGDRKTVTLTNRETKATKNGKPMLVFSTTDNDKIFLFSRQLFKDAGYIDGDEWATIGESEAFRLTCEVEADEKGYWQIVPETVPPFDPEFAAIEFPGMPTPQFDGDIPM